MVGRWRRGIGRVEGLRSREDRGVEVEEEGGCGTMCARGGGGAIAERGRVRGGLPVWMNIQGLGERGFGIDGSVFGVGLKLVRRWCCGSKTRDVWCS